MKFEIKKSFFKDLNKINDNKLAEEVKSLFNIIKKTVTRYSKCKKAKRI